MTDRLDAMVGTLQLRAGKQTVKLAFVGEGQSGRGLLTWAEVEHLKKELQRLLDNRPVAAPPPRRRRRRRA